MEKETDKIVITVVGKDTVGIIARICVYLAEHGINVLDISQTIVQDYFNMMMVADLGGSEVPFDECAAAMDTIGQEIGVVITCQKEEIFEMMHRV